MTVGRVVGSLISTRKCDNLIGSKFAIVEPLDIMNAGKERLVAVDIIGAGVGEMVLVATGSSARIGSGLEKAPVDAAIVAIIDIHEVQK